MNLVESKTEPEPNLIIQATTSDNNLLNLNKLYVLLLNCILVSFVALPPGTLQSLKTNREKARSFVLFHTTQGRIKTDKMKNNQVSMYQLSCWLAFNITKYFLQFCVS